MREPRHAVGLGSLRPATRTAALLRSVSTMLTFLTNPASAFAAAVIVLLGVAVDSQGPTSRPRLPGRPMDCQGADVFCPGTVIVVTTDGRQPLMSPPSVRFDFDGDGASEVLSWPVEPESAAFLAIDRNGNGLVDDGRELFTEFTVEGAPDGFSALVRLFESSDGIPKIAQLDRSHRLFSQLMLWADRNRNGRSEEPELQPVSVALHAIGLGMTSSSNQDPSYPYTGWVRTRSGIEQPIHSVVMRARRR